MPKAHEVASELRKLADSLDREPDARVQPAWITFYCHTKEPFQAVARAMLRPLVKRDGHNDRYELVYGDITRGPIHIECSVDKSAACKLIQPAQEAVYECLPILSEAEEAALETAVTE